MNNPIDPKALDPAARTRPNFRAGTPVALFGGREWVLADSALGHTALAGEKGPYVWCYLHLDEPASVSPRFEAVYEDAAKAVHAARGGDGPGYYEAVVRIAARRLLRNYALSPEECRALLVPDPAVWWRPAEAAVIMLAVAEAVNVDAKRLHEGWWKAYPDGPPEGPPAVGHN